MKDNIRIAELNDANELDSLLAKLLLYEKENYSANIKTGITMNGFFIKRINKDNVILVYEIDKKIVGFIYGYIDSTNKVKTDVESYIEYLYVDTEYRDRGIGTNLINEFIKLVKEKGTKYIKIENMIANKKTQKLYNNLGFDIYIEERRKSI